LHLDGREDADFYAATALATPEPNLGCFAFLQYARRLGMERFSWKCRTHLATLSLEERQRTKMDLGTLRIRERIVARPMISF
jgi:hypothetical protein